MNSAIFSFVLLAVGVSGCRPDMFNQPKVKTYSETELFRDETSARPIPPHTVRHGSAEKNDVFYTGLTNNILVTRLPMKLTPELLAQGRERFDIFCANCHGRIGDGNGLIVRRGFPAPPSYHIERLRNAPIGHFYDVITNGYGVMSSYAAQLAPNDRWAIAAYIRALQFSQNAKANELTPNEEENLKQQP